MGHMTDYPPHTPQRFSTQMRLSLRYPKVIRNRTTRYTPKLERESLLTPRIVNTSLKGTLNSAVVCRLYR